jgi:hypothetical protein
VDTHNLHRDLLRKLKDGTISDEEKKIFQTVKTDLETFAQDDSTPCDHGSIGKRWTFDILKDALRTKDKRWVLVKHTINSRSISVEDAKDFIKIEEKYGDTGCAEIVISYKN